MRFDFSALLSGLIFGIVGFLAFKRGKSRTNYPLLACGIVLMVYNIFSPNPWTDWLIGLSVFGYSLKIWNV